MSNSPTFLRNTSRRSTPSRHSDGKRPAVKKPVALIPDDLFLQRIEKHIQQVTASFASQYGLGNGDRENMAQELRLHAWRKIPMEKRGIGSYVRTCINNRARSYWRYLKRRRKRVSFVSDETLADIPAPSATTASIESDHTVATVLAGLTPLQQKIVQIHVLGDGDQPPIRDFRRICKMVPGGMNEHQCRAEWEIARTRMKDLYLMRPTTAEEEEPDSSNAVA